jgi:hypothetical protein
LPSIRWMRMLRMTTSWPFKILLAVDKHNVWTSDLSGTSHGEIYLKGILKEMLRFEFKHLGYYSRQSHPRRQQADVYLGWILVLPCTLANVKYAAPWSKFRVIYACE